MKKPRFHSWEPTKKENYIDQQIAELIPALINAGAQFYIYRYWEIMYLNGQVIDLFRKSVVLDLPKRVGRKK